jgi:hypothetical protein
VAAAASNWSTIPDLFRLQLGKFMRGDELNFFEPPDPNAPPRKDPHHKPDRGLRRGPSDKFLRVINRHGKTVGITREEYNTWVVITKGEEVEPHLEESLRGKLGYATGR